MVDTAGLLDSTPADAVYAPRRAPAVFGALPHCGREIIAVAQKASAWSRRQCPSSSRMSRRRSTATRATRPCCGIESPARTAGPPPAPPVAPLQLAELVTSYTAQPPEKLPNTLGEDHGRKDRQERGPMPVHERQARAGERRLAAEPAGHPRSPPQLRSVRSDGRRVRLRQGIQEPRPQCRDQRPACPDDAVPGLVAGRLRP